MKYSLIFIGFFILFSGFAQDPEMDSLFVVFQKKPTDLSTLYAIYLKAQKLDSLEITNLYQRAQTVVKNESNPLANAQVERYWGELFLKKGYTTLALEHFLKAYQISKKAHIPYEQANCLQVLGNLYNSLERSSDALHYWLKSAKLYDSLGFIKNRNELNHSIANLYFKVGFWSDSEKYFESLILESPDSISPRSRINSWNGLGLINYKYKEFETSLDYFNKALEIAKVQKDTVWIGILYGNIGNIYRDTGKEDQAYSYYLIDLQISEKYQEWAAIINVLVTLGELSLQRKEYNKAKAYFERGLNIAKQHNLDAHILYRGLSQLHYAFGDYQKAYDLFQIYQKTEDSLQILMKENAVAKIKNTLEFSDKEEEIQSLRQENTVVKANNELQNIVIFNNIALIIVIGILAYILYRSNLQKQKNNELLTDQKNEIEALNENLEHLVTERTQQLQKLVQDLFKQNQDLEQFSYILSHNIRASVAHLLGLTHIFNIENFSDPYNQEVLKHMDKSAKNLDRVIKDLGQILTIRRSSMQEKENIDIPEFFEDIKQGLNADIKKINATIETDFHLASSLFSARPYLYNIIYQLLTNAIKYHSEARPLLIKIKTTILKNYFVLTVEDNGLGLDLSKTELYKIFGLYQRMHTHVEGKGLGLFLAKMQAEALGGRIELESKLDVGSKFTVYLPMNS